MSEVNLQALADTDNDRIEAKAPTPMQEVNDALKKCGFGLFHIQILLSSFCALVSGILTSNTTSYLLPSAECDLKMNLVEKGLLNAIPYIGMLFSTLLAGFLTDTFGRKVFIYTGLGGSCFFMIVAGTSQSYEVLITSKFLEGILFATSFSAMITLTSEFCHNGIRDRVVICQSSFQSMAQVLLAVMSWGILTNNWRYTLFDGKLVLNTWNFYLYLMSLWSFTACILYIFVPESPKYMVTQGKYAETREILTKIYRMNNRKAEDQSPFKDLFKTEQKLEKVQENKNNGFAHHIVVGLHNVKPMFQKPLLFYLILICSMNFCIMNLYNVVRLWFPQVSTIVEHNSFITENGDTQNLCQMLDTYTHNLVETRNETAVCIPKTSGAETYINSIILGSVSIIPYFLSGMLVTKVGKKPLIIIGSCLTVGITLGMRWATSKALVVSLFAADCALSQSMMSFNQAFIMEFFPTTTRTLAISMIMMMGRIGTLVGNIGFPVLLKMGCVIPFYSLAGVMICVIFMAIFLPTKKK
ncbi:putative transporter SVOPL [Ostrinia furnacalis]|uniref:putative transporter SVOPL n=1 Tax=Ostrinia furnacalis TaxID=93504 RepID=UPI00103D9754|nr:putative transporter SVOPL [Ostrinia furnacalis]